MRVDRIAISNFRGIKSLTLSFDDELNIFMGNNGAGKTTVLDSVSLMLSWAVNRINSINAAGRHIQDNDITNKESSSRVEIEIVYKGNRYCWRLVKNRKGHGSGSIKSDYSELNILVKEFHQLVSLHQEKVNIPVFVYYPVNRAVIDVPLRIRKKHQFDLLGALEGGLSSGATFKMFFEWFREREDLENENLKIFNQLSQDGLSEDGLLHPDPQLEAVRNALKFVLPEFDSLSVRRNPLRMEIKKNGNVLTVNQLSDGEKCLIAMIGDLARRMAIANPMRSNPLIGYGIVMIDEICLHLHPKWQRMVVPRLQAVFPNCQFLISTHSPHVITQVKPSNIFSLSLTETNGITASKPIESYGKNIDRVLEDLMGLETTRPDEVEKLLRNLFQLIDAGNLEQAKEKINDLRLKIGEDPELSKARVLIRRKEIIGK